MSVRQTLAVLMLAALLGGCDRVVKEDKEKPATRPPAARLTLVVTPVNGDAPLAVRLAARLDGEVEDPDRFRCPSLAWTLGNGDVVLARATDCRSGQVARDFTLDYTYRTAGAYDASVRLLALDVPASRPVSVLVRGPTATPAPVAAVPGPTIVIATAARAPTVTVRPTRAGTATAPATASLAPARTATPTSPAVTRVAVAPPRTLVPTTVPATRAPVTRQAAQPSPSVAPSALPATAAPTVVAGAGWVLPADLYYLAGRPARVWRLPASGGSPVPVSGPGPAVTDFDLAASGLLATVTDGQLQVTVPGAPAVTVAPSGASDPSWSPDGQQLAYATTTGVQTYDLGTATRTTRAPDGVPLAWSRAGDWLAIRRDDGNLSLVSLPSGARQDLPLGPVTAAGWLPDRDVLWLAGPGLKLLTVGDILQVTDLLAMDQTVLATTVTADSRLLAVVDAPDGPVLQEIDLQAEMLRPRVAGPPLALPGSDMALAWAPGGQTLAVAGSGAEGPGLQLMAPVTGAAVPLLDEAAERPQWVLRSR